MGTKHFPTGKDVFVCNCFFQPNLPLVFSMDTSKRTKELPMTVPELKSTVYLFPEAAWPIIMQNVANTGNRLLCSEMTSDTLG